MNKICLILMLCLVLTDGICQSLGFKPQHSAALDAEKGKSLLSQCSRGTPRDVTDYWKVTSNDIKLLEDNFKKIKKLKSRECCFPGKRISNLNKYGFQYIGVTIQGKKYIYINAFHIDPKDHLDTFSAEWETEPLVVCDGGDYYWGVLFDLEKLNFKDLMINGFA